jgi:hypothetical protein
MAGAAKYSEALKGYKVSLPPTAASYFDKARGHHVRIDLRTCTKAQVAAAVKAGATFIEKEAKK